MESPPITDNDGTLRIVKLFSRSLGKFHILSTKTSIPKLIYNIKHTVKDTVQKSIVNETDCECEILEQYSNESLSYGRIIYWKTHHLERMGQTAELRHIESFGRIFQSEIQKSKFKYTTVDFFLLCIKFVIELKHRECSHSKYPTAFINLCKITRALSKNIIFVFEYTDGLYYLQYQKELFDTFDIDYNRQFGNSRPQDVINIPTKHLIKLEPTDRITLVKHYPSDDRFFDDWIAKDNYMFRISM